MTRAGRDFPRPVVPRTDLDPRETELSGECPCVRTEVGSHRDNVIGCIPESELPSGEVTGQDVTLPRGGPIRGAASVTGQR